MGEALHRLNIEIFFRNVLFVHVFGYFYVFFGDELRIDAQSCFAGPCSAVPGRGNFCHFAWASGPA